MALGLLLFLIGAAVLATAAVTFYRTDVVPFPKGLYAGEDTVAEVQTSTLLQRQRTTLTSLRLVQAEKRLPILPPPWQHRGSFLDLREVNSVHLSLGLSTGLLVTAFLVSLVFLPVGWLLLGLALITRVVTLDLRAGTARMRIATARRRAAPLASFFGAVQRLARADKGLPDVLRAPAPGWDLLDDGWFHLDGIEFAVFAAMTAMPVVQLIVQGGVSLGDPVVGSLAVALAAFAGARRGVVSGAFIGLSSAGALLGGLCPFFPAWSGLLLPVLEILGAALLLGLVGTAAGLLRRLNPAIGPLGAAVWLAMPVLHDRTLYDHTVVYLTAACGAALAALAILASPPALTQPAAAPTTAPATDVAGEGT